MNPSLRSDSHRRMPAIVSRPLTQNGVAERFPDWTAVGFRASYTPPIIRLREQPHSCSLPDPVPRIACPSRPFLAHLRHAGSDASLVGELSPPGRYITCGDLNPICLPGPSSRPISSGWPDRWPPTSALPAFGCFAGPSLQRSRTHLREPFSFSPCTFVSDDERKYTRAPRNRQKYLHRAEKLSTDFAQAMI